MNTSHKIHKQKKHKNRDSIMTTTSCDTPSSSLWMVLNCIVVLWFLSKLYQKLVLVQQQQKRLPTTTRTTNTKSMVGEEEKEMTVAKKRQNAVAFVQRFAVATHRFACQLYAGQLLLLWFFWSLSDNNHNNHNNNSHCNHSCASLHTTERS